MHIDAAVKKAFGEMISGMASVVNRHPDFVITSSIENLPVLGDDGVSIDLPGYNLERAVVRSRTPVISHSYVITDSSLKVEPKSSITVLQTLEMLPLDLGSYLNAIETEGGMVHMPSGQLSPLTAIICNYTFVPAVQLQFNHRRAEPSGAKVGWFVAAKFYGDGRRSGPVWGISDFTNSTYRQEPIDFHKRMLPIAANPIETFKLLADALASGPKYDLLLQSVSR